MPSNVPASRISGYSNGYKLIRGQFFTDQPREIRVCLPVLLVYVLDINVNAVKIILVDCIGDLEVDGHHTVEDVGIALGQAILMSLGDKIGINRYGEAYVPMDESLARCVVDISGRPYLVFKFPSYGGVPEGRGGFPAERVGEFETELTEEFFRALASNAGITLHLNVEYGKNTHHMIEALFKAFGSALKQAIDITSDGIPSTKGVL